MGCGFIIAQPESSALEACSQDRIEKLSSTIDTLNPFEEKRDYFATSILSESGFLTRRKSHFRINF